MGLSRNDEQQKQRAEQEAQQMQFKAQHSFSGIDGIEKRNSGNFMGAQQRPTMGAHSMQPQGASVGMTGSMGMMAQPQQQPFQVGQMQGGMQQPNMQMGMGMAIPQQQQQQQQQQQ